MSERRKMVPFWMPLLFGLLGVSRLIDNPRLAGVRAVDIVQLIASGMCLGVALTTLVTLLRAKNATRP